MQVVRVVGERRDLEPARGQQLADGGARRRRRAARCRCARRPRSGAARRRRPASRRSRASRSRSRPPSRRPRSSVRSGNAAVSSPSFIVRQTSIASSCAREPSANRTMRRCDLAPRTRSRRHQHQVGRARRRRPRRRRRQPADRGRGRAGPRRRAAGAGGARGRRGRRARSRRRASACRGSTTTRTAASASSRTCPGRGPAIRSAHRSREALGVPVRLINDARAFTLAEARVGAGRGCASLVGVTLGTGVGGGIVLDGRLLLGVHGTAGEIGHQVIDLRPDAPRCGCGNTGCLESYVGAARAGARRGHGDGSRGVRGRRARRAARARRRGGLDRLPRDRPREPRDRADARSHRARRRRVDGRRAHHHAAARPLADARAPDRSQSRRDRARRARRARRRDRRRPARPRPA